MLRSIMVETGDSDCARAAMATAQRLAQAFNARLYALACLDERAVDDEHIRGMLENYMRERQARFEEECRQMGIECSSELEVGEPGAAIAHLSRKADLMVLGAKANPTAEDRDFSARGAALARRLVRHVLAVRATPPEFKRIVVGYAGQENSCNALQLSAHIAERMGGTVHVLTSSADVAAASGLLKIAMSYLDAFEVEAVQHQAKAEAGEALFELVTETGADVVAIGAVRRSRLAMMAFGDTASRVLDMSPASVLIAR